MPVKKLRLCHHFSLRSASDGDCEVHYDVCNWHPETVSPKKKKKEKKPSKIATTP